MIFNLSFITLGLAALAVAAPPTPVKAARSPTTPALSKRTDHYGPATYYFQEGAYGSCGKMHPDDSKIVALSNYWMDKGGYCGRKISIKNLGGGQDNQGTGNVVIATVADTCPGCTENHLDLSEGAFQALTGGPLDPPGTFDIVWHFCGTNGVC